MKSLSELMGLKGRVALITGGGGYIGSAIGDALAELGAAVVILDKHLSKSEAVAENLNKVYGIPTLGIGCNLLEEEEIRFVPKKVADVCGRLDILVNCAALVGTDVREGWNAPFEEQISTPWRLALEMNLTAPFFLTQICTPLLRASGHGSVINISSIYGVVAPDFRIYDATNMGNPAAYAASKGGLLQMTKWLSTALAPDVRVNAITPGGIFRNQPQSFCENYIQRTPLARMATEEDLKGAAAYLSSDLSAYVTGQNLIVDGGWTVW